MAIMPAAFTELKGAVCVNGPINAVVKSDWLAAEAMINTA